MREKSGDYHAVENHEEPFMSSILSLLTGTWNIRQYHRHLKHTNILFNHLYSVISRSTVNKYKFPHTYQTLSVTTFHGARWLWPNMEHCKDSLIHHSWATRRTSQTKGKWANRRNSYKCGRNFRFSHLGTETSRPSVLGTGSRTGSQTLKGSTSVPKETPIWKSKNQKGYLI